MITRANNPVPRDIEEKIRAARAKQKEVKRKFQTVLMFDPKHAMEMWPWK